MCLLRDGQLIRALVECSRVEFINSCCAMDVRVIEPILGCEAMNVLEIGSISRCEAWVMGLGDGIYCL